MTVFGGDFLCVSGISCAIGLCEPFGVRFGVAGAVLCGVWFVAVFCGVDEFLIEF